MTLDLFDDVGADSETAHRARIRDQKRLLQRCAEKNLSLTEELTGRGLTMDDLRYVHQPKRSIGAMPRSWEAGSPERAGAAVISFFTGAGGMDIGFSAAGFHTKVAIEHNALFCDTLRFNHPNWTVLGPPDSSGDVSQVHALVDELSAARVRRGRSGYSGIFVGGPPCQPFSIAANQRFARHSGNFKRTGFAHEKNGNLLFDYVELIRLVRPKAFVIENVPGLMDIDGGEQLRRAYSVLQKEGYRIAAPMVLNAADYGVPQNRRRLFVVGARTRHELPAIPPRQPRLACGPVLEKATVGVANHLLREHSAASVLRYMELEYGQRDQLGRVDRLNPSLPSKTVIAGGVSGGGRSHLHPYAPRTLSVRECARLQTFPDSYEFLGPMARQFTQVGNAVPPHLARVIASELIDPLF